LYPTLTIAGQSPFDLGAGVYFYEGVGVVRAIVPQEGGGVDTVVLSVIAESGEMLAKGHSMEHATAGGIERIFAASNTGKFERVPSWLTGTAVLYTNGIILVNVAGDLAYQVGQISSTPDITGLISLGGPTSGSARTLRLSVGGMDIRDELGNVVGGVSLASSSLAHLPLLLGGN